MIQSGEVKQKKPLGKTPLKESLGNEEIPRLHNLAQKMLSCLDRGESFNPELLALLGLALRVEAAAELAACLSRLEGSLRKFAAEIVRLPRETLDQFHPVFKDAIAACDRNMIRSALTSEYWPALSSIYEAVQKFLAEGDVREIEKLLETAPTSDSVHTQLSNAATSATNAVFKIHVESRRLLGQTEQILLSALRHSNAVTLHG